MQLHFILAQSCQCEHTYTTSTLNRIHSAKILIIQGQVTWYHTLTSTLLVLPHFSVSPENSDPQVLSLATATVKQILKTGTENRQKSCYYLLPHYEIGFLKCIHIRSLEELGSYCCRCGSKQEKSRPIRLDRCLHWFYFCMYLKHL